MKEKASWRDALFRRLAAAPEVCELLGGMSALTGIEFLLERPGTSQLAAHCSEGACRLPVDLASGDGADAKLSGNGSLSPGAGFCPHADCPTCAYAEVRMGGALIGVILVRTPRKAFAQPLARRGGTDRLKPPDSAAEARAKVFKSGIPSTLDVARAKIEAIAFRLHRGGAASTHPSLRKALAICRQEFADKGLDIDDVARRAGLSTGHLRSLLRREMGMTFSEFLRRLRTDHAERLLVDPSVTVLDAAMRSGFGSVWSLNRAFRTLRGAPPRRRKTSATP